MAIETQKSVHEWCKATFTRHIGVKGRAVALVEEAVELALACGVDSKAIKSVVEVPIIKESIRLFNGERKWHDREDAEEVADVLLCLYAYAEEAGYDAHKELDEKMALNRTRSKEYYANKTAEKEDWGYILPDAPQVK
jgi:NTP pyrophosphatase (non-canonical NTP hydrolase)